MYTVYNKICIDCGSKTTYRSWYVVSRAPNKFRCRRCHHRIEEKERRRPIAHELNRRVREDRKNNPNKYIEYEKRRRQRPARKVWMRVYYKAYREKNREQLRAYRLKKKNTKR